MADEYRDATDATRLAIEFLSIWLEGDQQAATEHIARVIHAPGGPHPIVAINGLLILSHFMVLEIAKTRGATDAASFNALAREYLANMSINLPPGPDGTGD
ncbi:hypothetical protein ACFYWH_05440 [Streptomyces sp. NPDC003737]|uniref:hypothetical protein n=1 Tax=Streptomyces sp. NPDC003737 TaxID=3364685 RepID=UPI0036A74A9D